MRIVSTIKYKRSLETITITTIIFTIYSTIYAYSSNYKVQAFSREHYYNYYYIQITITTIPC